MSAPRTFMNWAIGRTLGRTVEVRSIFFATVFLVVLFVLAYLTNPSETSFRAFLTEQSFRQHLSRLDDNQDDEAIDSQQSFNYTVSRRCSSTSCRPLGFQTGGTTFHFANRASVSMRTPRHVFRRFGILTVAAVIPVAPSCQRANSADRGGSTITDSWYIGAFGKWWRAGLVESWWRSLAISLKDAERSTSGILDIKSLDKFEGYDGLPYAANALRPRPRVNGSPPRLRGRESRQRNGILPVRSSTPPLLPLSALPLHTTRFPPSTPERLAKSVSCLPSTPPFSGPQHLQNSGQVQLSPPVPTRSPSTIFDQSPTIVEVLRQIATSKSNVYDLRTELDEFRARSSESHSVLQNDVDVHREQKRQEDMVRLELKSRTKTLEDSKRHAEGTKRDAEKKLKLTETTRDNTSRRIEQLGKEMDQMRQRMVGDKSAIATSNDETSVAAAEISEALDQRKQDIKDVEDDIAALGNLARDLEERVASEKERLRRAHEQAEIRRQDRSFQTLHVANNNTDRWVPLSYDDHELQRIIPHPQRSDEFPRLTDEEHRRVVPVSAEPVTSPKPRRLSLTGISNFDRMPTVDPSVATLRAKGYSIFDSDIASLAHFQQRSTNFAPFGDSEPNPQFSNHTTLIPNSLIGTLDKAEQIARALHPNSDPILDGDWHTSRMSGLQRSASLLRSPVSGTGFPLSEDHDPFEVRMPSDMYRGALPNGSQSDPPVPNLDDVDANANKRWQAKEKERKRLNPDAKVFSLPPKRGSLLTASGAPSTSPFEVLNAHPAPLTAPSHFFSPMRVFAPSRAEREVLQRALGSNNASLERLPSLSMNDVSSHPSSPSHSYAVAQAQGSGGEQKATFPSLSWLETLPSVKPNFSPWDDELLPSANGVPVGGNGQKGDAVAVTKPVLHLRNGRSSE